jgi:16S rRNA (adenine1518-N6/adenine1519-N6)-dimethyltransferase
VLEIGAGIGSLTLALAHTGAKILAIEFDRALIPALEEVTKRLENVSVVQADATQMDLASLVGRDRWVLCANLPYNVATPVVLRVLAEAPGVHRLVVMVQREAGERFVASPGGPGYGPTSLRVAFHTNAAVVRSVPPEVFWPRPAVESVVVRMERVASAPVSADQSPLWRVVDESFRERRKTMRNALRRLGMDGSFAEAVLDRCGVPPQARPEQLGLQDFSCLAEELAR